MNLTVKLTTILSISFTVAGCGLLGKRNSDSTDPNARVGNQAPKDPVYPPWASAPVREAILGRWKTNCFINTKLATGTGSSVGRVIEVTFSSSEVISTERIFEDPTCETLRGESVSKSTYTLGDNNRNLDTFAAMLSFTFFTSQAIENANKYFVSTEACPVNPWVARETQSFAKNFDACGLQGSLYTIVELKDGQLFMGDALDPDAPDGSTQATRIEKINSDAVFVKQN